MKEEFYYKSTDNLTNIHAYIWKPLSEVKAIVQISHGMVEHVGRYEHLALELNRYGILVCGNDHLGHGLSIVDKNHQGYFAQKKGYEVLVDDLYTLTSKVKEEYPNVPIYVIGHSMGSFIVRNYLTKYSEDITGAVIIGSSYKPQLFMTSAQVLTWFTQLYHHGWFYRSPLLYKLTNGGFAKYFEEGKENIFCWLSTNPETIKKYIDDPLTKFKFTCNGYMGLFTSIKKACQKSKSKKIKKDIKLLIMSGADDPVGNFGKDIYKIANQYRKSDIKNIRIKLYNGMRHELLNETDNVLVINDIVNFITK